MALKRDIILQLNYLNSILVLQNTSIRCNITCSLSGLLSTSLTDQFYWKSNFTIRLLWVR